MTALLLLLQTPAAGHPDKVFLEFDPLPLRQHAGKPSLAFDTFDAALDAFFAKVRQASCTLSIAFGLAKTVRRCCRALDLHSCGVLTHHPRLHAAVGCLRQHWTIIRLSVLCKHRFAHALVHLL